MKSHQLTHILNNKTLGSSELVILLNDYILSIRNNKPEIIKTIMLAKAKLNHFEAVNTYLNEINYLIRLKNRLKLIEFLKNFSMQEDERLEAIFKKIKPKLESLNCIITLSRSGTLVGILKLWHRSNKKLKVVVCESRPKFEGRIMAKELAEYGINIILITDAMMGLYISKIDAAIIGADAVLINGNIVNKVGSKALALLCKEYKKPFYVVTSKWKLSKKNIFKPMKENPKEICDTKVKYLSINNIYFEEIEKKFITKIFTK